MVHQAPPDVCLKRERTFEEVRDNINITTPAAEKTEFNLPPYRSWADRKKKRADRPWVKAQKAAEKAYKRYIVEGLLRQKPIPPSKDGRHIPLQPGLARRKSLKDERTGHAYISNFIRSSRYTVWNFFPKQLFFQFSKLANFLLPGHRTTGTYTTIGPLIAFVALSMAKEGYDDYRRYRMDKLENRSSACVLDPEGTVKDRSRADRLAARGFFKKEKTGSEEQVTELESVRADGVVSAQWAKVEWQDIRVGDIIRLQRDENVPADIILLSATGPNGVAFIETMALDGETNLKSKQASPLLAKHCSTTVDMGKCEAEVVSEDPNIDLYNYEGRVTVNGETMPLTSNEVVYRGSTLRNTSEAIGLVINSGEECKIRMNANKNARAKAPPNAARLGYIIWRGQYERKAFYLHEGSVSLGQIFIAFVIAYNTLIPLSLYVSLEIVKLGQLFLLSDIEMYDPVTDTPMVANTTTILENLGQVSFVFSDKTGTLTENMMKFRKMSVAGSAWLHDMDLQREAEKDGNQPVRREVVEPAEKGSRLVVPKFSARVADPEMMEQPLVEGRRSESGRPPRTSTASRWKSSVYPTPSQPDNKTEDLIQYLNNKPNSHFSRKTGQFILCMALCHTCLPETKDNGEISFQAASPDELALVEAARDLGYLLVDRAAQSMTLQIRNPDGTTTTEKYEILDVIEFSSKRKRMSIVIRMPDGRLCMFTKGADSAILPRLRQKQLAIQTASAIERRASMRRSVEQEKAFRRLSLQSPKRESMNLRRALDRKDSWRKSVQITDEVDHWLSRREGVDDEAGPVDGYRSPRRSMVGGRSVELARSFELSRLADPYDGLVDETLAINDAAVFERCFQHVDDFATEGLRTLIFAYRYLDEDDYRKWKTIFHQATTSLVKRQERIEDAAELIEQEFDLAGATAIEDKLQQGVPETIDKLRRANIKVWMLTGDKRETAINIAHSARICKPFSEVYILDVTQGDLQERLAMTLTDVCRGMVPHSVAVIDGHTLSVVEDSETLSVLFYDLVARVDSVICCRASPSQKANLVKCIRRQTPQAVTLAIGDGANDIAMIQSSHVGIGISGREGLQAARISDYSIAQFRFLQRLLFVHGRWNYVRSGKYILGTFWKEVIFYLIQAHYQRYNGYTGTSIYESTSLTVFNTIFTSLPVIIPGIFERDLSAETLLALPELYSFGQKCRGFNYLQYLGWMFMAVAESVVVYYAVHYIYANVSHWPVETDLFPVGTLVYSLAVVFINLKLMFLEVHDRTLVILGGMVVSMGGWWLWNIVLSALMKKTVAPYVVRDAFLYGFGSNGMWWLVHFVVLSALVVFELGVTAVRRSLWPTDRDLMQEVESVQGVKEVLREHAAGNGGYPPAAAAAGNAASRRATQEFVRPQFTPPAEERENPMESLGAKMAAEGPQRA
ncbi:drs2 neo1 protein [Collariella sp. IMI 366227]|nr:drs2 neo1 protein [Collariella sp. IMI 366227]